MPTLFQKDTLKKKIYTAETVKEASNLLKGEGAVIDKDTMVYLDNMILADKEGKETVEFGTRVQTFIMRKGVSFMFVCSLDVSFFSEGTFYIPKTEMIKYLIEERSKEDVEIRKKKLQKAIKESKNVVIVGYYDVNIRKGKDRVLTVKTGKELDRLIEKGEVGKESLIFLEKDFPYEYINRDLGMHYYWKLKRIGCEVILIYENGSKINFSGMKHIAKPNLADYLY